MTSVAVCNPEKERNMEGGTCHVKGKIAKPAIATRASQRWLNTKQHQ